MGLVLPPEEREHRALQVWKDLVANTPRTLRSVLPDMMRMVIAGLSSAEADPFRVHQGSAPGTALSVASYGRGRAEVLSREAECHLTQRFQGDILGFDELEVDTTVPVENIRDVTVNDIPVPFEVAYARDDAFRLLLPLIDGDGDVLEFAFDLPVFRFGTTFSGRVVNSRFERVPQRLEAGNANDFGPGDDDDLSNLFVSIPEERIGKLVGTIALSDKVITPNGDGINDDVHVQFNLLQLVDVAPVRFEVFDLAGRRVANLDLGERSLGPADFRWDGTGSDGRLLTPGTYVWRLLVAADAFDEEHLGILAVAY